MKRLWKTLGTWVVPLLLTLLTACQTTFELQVESGGQSVPSNPTLVAVQPSPSTASITLTPEGEVAASPTPTATLTAIPGSVSTPEHAATASPSPTPSPTSSPTSTSTPAPPSPVILSFNASPTEAGLGETIRLAWQARGQRARICPTARFVLFTEDDCRPVTLSGTEAFTIPNAAAGFQHISFVLTVESGSASSTAQVSVALRCARTWFYSEEPQSGICPREPLATYAAAQPFENGLMIWLEEPGRYYILIDEPLYAGEARKHLEVIHDPLLITGDTSRAFEPPQGLYAPVSGFGLVWRGDIEQSPGFRQELGWALEPEAGYDALLQCDDALPSGGRTWQTCYLKDPEGNVIVLHPLGGWYILTEPSSP